MSACDDMLEAISTKEALRLRVLALRSVTFKIVFFMNIRSKGREVRADLQACDNTLVRHLGYYSVSGSKSNVTSCS